MAEDKNEEKIIKMNLKSLIIIIYLLGYLVFLFIKRRKNWKI